jgi:hypothetical protein
MISLKKLFSIFSIFIIGFTIISSTLNVSAATTLLPSTSTICGTEANNAAGGNGSCLVTGGKTLTGGVSGITGTIIEIARVITYISGALSVLFLVYGGVRYLISQDDKEVGAARTIIQNAIVGLVITVIAYSIISIVTALLSGTLIGS